MPRSGLSFGRSIEGVLTTMPNGDSVKESDYVLATERLYVNADRSKIVAEGSDEAAFLLATPGKRIPRADAERLGLLGDVESKARSAPPSTKQVKGPPANKGRG